MSQSLTYSVEDYRGWNEIRQATRPHFQEVYRRISPWLEDADEVLDVAGGEGHTHDVLPELSSSLVTLDIDAVALQRLTTRHPEAKTVQADIGQLPFDDETFAAVISINGINRTSADNDTEEITRVLKPGGLFVFLYDLPFAFGSLLEESRADDPDSKDFYDLPTINPASRTVDQAVSIHRNVLTRPRLREKIADRLPLDQIDALLEGDWMKKIYDNPMKMAAYAKLFTRLAAEVKMNAGESQVTLWEPYAPLARQQDMARFNRQSGVSAEVSMLEVDYRTEDAHRIEGRPVSQLRVDDFSLPHIIYKDEAASTRVKGRTPVFMVRKDP